MSDAPREDTRLIRQRAFESGMLLERIRWMNRLHRLLLAGRPTKAQLGALADEMATRPPYQTPERDTNDGAG